MSFHPRFCICHAIFHISLSLSDLLHSEWQSLGWNGPFLTLFFEKKQGYLVDFFLWVGVFSARDSGLIPGSGRSPGEGNDYLLQYSCLESPMDKETWWTTIRGSQRVRQDWAINTFTFSLDFVDCIFMVKFVCSSALDISYKPTSGSKVLIRL